MVVAACLGSVVMYARAFEGCNGIDGGEGCDEVADEADPLPT